GVGPRQTVTALATCGGQSQQGQQDDQATELHRLRSLNQSRRGIDSTGVARCNVRQRGEASRVENCKCWRRRPLAPHLRVLLHIAACTTLHGWATESPSSPGWRRNAGVLLVGDLLHPVDDLDLEVFLNGEVGDRSGGR